MAYVKAIYKKRGKQSEKDLLKRNEIINSSLMEYLNDDCNNYNYYFDKDEPRDGEGHDETCYLSAIIFLNLIIKYFKTINGLNRVNEKDTRLYYFLTDADSTHGSRMIRYNGGKAIIGFDIMNNPNKPEKGANNVLDQHFGNSNEIKELKNIYHRIGNITFFPRKDIDNDVRDIQHIHKYNSEDWNKTLNYMQENWKKYQFYGFCEFEEYIKMSLQQFYTKKGWGYLKNIILKDKDQYQKLTCDNKIYEKELKDFYNVIKNYNDEIYHIEYDNHDITVINAIVKIRSKLIIMLLNGKIKT